MCLFKECFLFVKIFLWQEEKELKKEEEAVEKKKGDKRNLVSVKKGSENGFFSKILGFRKGERLVQVLEEIIYI